MNSPLWQILCVTLESRRHFLDRLRSRLDPQLTDEVEFVTLEDNGERSICQKRQAMLEAATAPWVCFFDDDDVPGDDYVSRILGVIKADACDVVGFKLRYASDGRDRGIAVHSYDAAGIPVGPLPRMVVKMNRLPNHLNPVRREIALQAGFPVHIPGKGNVGEDSHYAYALSHLRPRPREHFIDAVLYEYWHRSQSRRPREEVDTTNEARRKRGEVAVA